MKKSIHQVWLAVPIGMMLAFTGCSHKKNPDTETAQSVQAAEDDNKNKTADTDLKDDFEFAVKAADGGMYEVELGKLAVSKATSSAVKQLGQMMVDDHSKANAELKAIAAEKNISLPTVLSDKLQKKYDELSRKNGSNFDRDYASAMVSDHKEDIALFKKEADDGNDTTLKTFAQGKIPVLEHHLGLSKSTKDGLRE